MSWWCNQGGGGTAGIAYVGTLCMGDGYNTNLNEGDSSRAVSGYVSAPVFIHVYDIIHISKHYYGNIEYIGRQNSKTLRYYHTSSVTTLV